MKRFLLFTLLSVFVVGVKGQVSLTNGSPSFTIDFSNSMPTTVGSNPSTAFAGAGFEPNPTTAGRLNSNAWAATGWSNGDLTFGGTQTTANTDYTRGSTNVAVATGGFYAYTDAPASVANPTLMIQPGGSDWAPGTLTLRIQNNGVSAITDLALSYNIYIRNDQSRSSSFNFSYSTDNSTYTPVAALDYTSIEAADGLGWVLVGTAPSRSTNITGLNVAPSQYIYLRWSGGDVSGSGSRDEFGLDDISATATFGSTNTIVIDNINTTPFALANCAATASGSVDITSTGTFNAGNTYIVQLSNDIGSFASPVNIGSIVSINNTESINITIPAGTVGGTGYKMRVVSSDPAVTGTESPAFTITQGGVGGCSSSYTDYYRSVNTGNWSNVSIWESSPDNLNWITATLAPTHFANTILIRNGHTVSVVSNTTADQVVVENGGILEHISGTFTIEDGTGDDVNIQNGAVFLLSTNSTSPTFGSGSPTIYNSTGGTIRVNATGLTGNGSGVNANNYVYAHQSILEYNPVSAFSTNNVTYFPNAGATTIPIFRTTNLSGIIVGANSSTTFNGVFECNGADVSWQLGGTKTFRNGIKGNGNVIALGTSGKFVINGETAELGGSGSLILPATGLEVGSASNNTEVTMVSDKTITGNIVFLNTNSSHIDLQNFNLTISTGTVSGAANNAYFKTSGTGVLTLPSVASAASLTYDIGNSTYNPLTITNNEVTTVTFSTRVEDAINPPTALPIYATRGIQRTWSITADASASPTVKFQYNTSDFGSDISGTDQVEILSNTGSPWSIVPSQINISQASLGGGVYTTTSLAPGLPCGTSAVKFIIGKNGGWILPVNCVVALKAQKRNNSGIISWTASSCTEVESFELQRSVNGAAFETIHTIRPSTSATDFVYTDAQLGRGRNLYRVKITGFNGDNKYSGTVALIEGSSDLFISSLSPNPATSSSRLTISAGKTAPVSLAIYNASGTVVKRWSTVVSEGNTTVDIDVANLAAGVYNVIAVSGDSKSVLKLVKQ